MLSQVSPIGNLGNTCENIKKVDLRKPGFYLGSYCLHVFKGETPYDLQSWQISRIYKSIMKFSPHAMLSAF